MGATRFVCASLMAGVLALVPARASAQETPQALRQEIDQLRKDFEAVKQLYGDRLSALEVTTDGSRSRQTVADHDRR